MLRVAQRGGPGGYASYHSPFLGTRSINTRQKRLAAATVAALTANEVDPSGYLKPGVPFTWTNASADATLVGAGVPVRGVTMEIQRIATTNSTADLTAAGAVQIVVGVDGQVSEAIMAEMLGRALTANEIAGFDLAGSHISLVRA